MSVAGPWLSHHGDREKATDDARAEEDPSPALKLRRAPVLEDPEEEQQDAKKHGECGDDVEYPEERHTGAEERGVHH